MKLDESGAMTRVGGIKWTIKDGIIYDAKQMLADVRAMVQKQKDERAGGKEAGDKPSENSDSNESKAPANSTEKADEDK